MALTKGIVERSKANGGSTTYISTGLAVTTGFALALSKKTETMVNNLTPEVIEDFIKKYYERFLKQEGNFLGTWFNNGQWHIDVSETFYYKEKALELAKQRELIAIYDLNKGEIIYIPY